MTDKVREAALSVPVVLINQFYVIPGHMTIIGMLEGDKPRGSFVMTKDNALALRDLLDEQLGVRIVRDDSFTTKTK